MVLAAALACWMAALGRACSNDGSSRHLSHPNGLVARPCHPLSPTTQLRAPRQMASGGAPPALLPTRSGSACLRTPGSVPACCQTGRASGVAAPSQARHTRVGGPTAQERFARHALNATATARRACRSRMRKASGSARFATALSHPCRPLVATAASVMAGRGVASGASAATRHLLARARDPMGP